MDKPAWWKVGAKFRDDDGEKAKLRAWNEKDCSYAYEFKQPGSDEVEQCFGPDLDTLEERKAFMQDEFWPECSEGWNKDD